MTAPTFAKWIARAGKELVRGVDLVVLLPLHRARLLKRQYNSVELLLNATPSFRALAGNPY
jgi:predicted amidophosphoribosyltransferase